MLIGFPPSGSGRDVHGPGDLGDGVDAGLLRRARDDADLGEPTTFVPAATAEKTVVRLMVPRAGGSPPRVRCMLS